MKSWRGWQTCYYTYQTGIDYAPETITYLAVKAPLKQDISALTT